jgi:hypothetical protein
MAEERPQTPLCPNRGYENNHRHYRYFGCTRVPSTVSDLELTVLQYTASHAKQFNM